MAYSDLTATQKTELQDWLSAVLRPWCGEQARANNHGQVVNNAYLANASSILDELSDTDEIPNTGGLSGATALTKSEVVGIVSHIQGIQSNYNTAGHRQMWTKAAGATNMIG